MDQGLIPGHRLPSGNRHRRCQKSEFRDYLTDQGISTDALDAMESRARREEIFGKDAGRG